MAWRMARLAAVLALGGLACGRTELMPVATGTEAGSGSTSGGLEGFGTGLDSGGLDTGRPTSGLDTSGAISITETFTTGLDTGVFDTGLPITTGATTEIDETGSPGTTSASETTTPGSTESEGGTTSAGTTDGGTTDGGTTSGGTTSGGTTDGGTTDGGTTSGGTTSGGTTDGGTTGGATDTGGTTGGATDTGGTTGGDLTCLDAVDCVLACGGASFSCIGQCNDGLSPEDNAAFNDLETCIIFACLFNGSCGFDFDDPVCVACRVDGQLDPAPLGCDDEAAVCF